MTSRLVKLPQHRPIRANIPRAWVSVPLSLSVCLPPCVILIRLFTHRSFRSHSSRRSASMTSVHFSRQAPPRRRGGGSPRGSRPSQTPALTRPTRNLLPSVRGCGGFAGPRRCPVALAGRPQGPPRLPPQVTAGSGTAAPAHMPTATSSLTARCVRRHAPAQASGKPPINAKRLCSYSNPVPQSSLSGLMESCDSLAH